MSYRQYHHERRFKDLFFVLLYLIATGFFVFLLTRYASHSGIFSDVNTSSKPHKSTGYQWLDSLCVHLERAPEIFGWNWIFNAFVILILTIILLGLFCAFPLFTIHFVFIAAIGTFLSLLIWQFMIPSWGSGFFWFFFVGTVLVIFLYVWSFRRLHFTALVIQNSLGVIRKYPGLLLVMLIGFLIGFILLSLGFVALSGAVGCALSGGEKGEPFSWFRFIFICLYLLWSIEILINWIHTTICGVFGCYYFYGDEEEENRGAVSLRILFRTLFYNWGSLIFGSLFTPFTDFMTCCLKRSSRRTSENIEECGAVERCFGALCICCCGWMSSIAETFNSYAFVQVGICGKSFYESAIVSHFFFQLIVPFFYLGYRIFVTRTRLFNCYGRFGGRRIYLGILSSYLHWWYCTC